VSSVRAEIEQQRDLDARWGGFQSTLDARIRAVLSARRAFARHELGAGRAFRQSLVDLAAVCEALAAELPRPHIPSSQAAERRI
jgi:hypothetical protein